MTRPTVAAHLVGLAVAWGGTALLVSPAARWLGSPERIETHWLGQIALWLLFAAILAIVTLWERQPLASLWLQRPRWQSVAWGLLFAVVSVALVVPVREWVRQMSGLGGYAAGMAQILVPPIWFRIIAVITAGVMEETLFSGYAVTRLARLTGSVWIAGALSAMVFTALHIPAWGPGPALAFLVGGVASTAFFIWRRDLLAMIVAHIAVDAWGLVITPLYYAWWTDSRFS